MAHGHRILAPSEIGRLVRRVKAEEHAATRHHPADLWFRDNVEVILNAVDNDETTVYLTDRLFTIRYELPERIFVRPSSGPLVPCGWLNLDRLREIVRLEKEDN